MAINVFEQTFQQIDSQLMVGLLSKVSSIIQLISPLFATLFTIYLMIVTYGYMRDGMSPETIMNDLFKRILAAGIIISCGLNYGFYSGHIIPIIQGIPNDLSMAISGGSVTTVAQIDALATIYVDAVIQMWEEASGIEGTIIALFLCTILTICTAPFFIVAAGYILLAKLFTLFLLVLAPIFIALALFPQTKNYTYLWVGQVVNFALLQVLFQITASVMMDIMNVQGFDPSTAGLTEVMSIALVSLLFTIVALKIPELASALGGGMSAGGGVASLVSMGSNVGRMMGKGSGGGNSNSNSNSNSGGAIKSESSGR